MTTGAQLEQGLDLAGGDAAGTHHHDRAVAHQAGSPANRRVPAGPGASVTARDLDALDGRRRRQVSRRW